MSCYWE